MTTRGDGGKPQRLARPKVSAEDKLSFRFFSLVGRLWAKIEALFARISSLLRRRRRQLGAEARILGAEFVQFGAQIWDKIDDLPFVPPSFKLTPIRTQFYGHGAFMGAAPALLADARWRRILAFLMPDVFEDVRAAIDAGADGQKIMPMFENNPVIAAFGTYRNALAPLEDESPHHLSGIEWDVFVDQDVIAEWEKVRKDPQALTEVMERVLDTSLIAHASAADTVQENMGVCQYKDVRKTRKTGLGGVEIDSWLDLFGRALCLARAEDLDVAVAEMAKEPRSSSDEACMLNTFAPPWPIQRAVAEHCAVTGKPNISAIVEIKSLRSTPEFLSDLVRALNARGVHVAAVASFLRDEVEGVSATAQTIHGVAYDPPREIQFFHFAGDLQAACDTGHVANGQSVLFNGASLLDAVQTDAGLPVYSTRLRVVSELETYRKKHDLHVGFYVQEGDCDHAAASLLSDLVAARPDTFELGFAWGGLRDEAHLPTLAVSRLGYGSQRMLEYVGKATQWKLGST